MALMTFEQLDRSIDADSDSEDELAEQAHLYRSKTSIESSSGSMVWANSRQWLPRRVNRLYRRRAPPAPFQR